MVYYRKYRPQTITDLDLASFVYDADVIDHDTRFMQRLVPILLRPQSPVQG